jgi:sodium-dependent dicarboxylate transporter 2/3/5
MGKEIIDARIAELGHMRSGERRVLVLFLLTATGWIFRQDIALGWGTIPGWANLLGVDAWVHDATVVMITTLLLFLIPANLRRGEFLLTWEEAVRIPWGILLLFGGGIALGSAVGETGLARWIGERTGFITVLPPFIMVMVLCLVMMILTEFTSNVATATIFMPVVAGIATNAGIHPYYLMVPATLAASCAFTLPVATPPNAVVFGSGHVKITDMVRAGVGLSLLGVIIIPVILTWIAFPLLGIEISQVPLWAR